MFARYSTALAALMLAAGLTIGTLGLLTGSSPATHGGTLLAVAALPPLIVAMLQRVHRVADERLAAAHADGYRLGVQHCHRGLITPPTGPGHPATRPQRNVIPMRRRPHLAPERKAQ